MVDDGLSPVVRTCSHHSLASSLSASLIAVAISAAALAAAALAAMAVTFAGTARAAWMNAEGSLTDGAADAADAAGAATCSAAAAPHSIMNDSRSLK